MHSSVHNSHFLVDLRQNKTYYMFQILLPVQKRRKKLKVTNPGCETGNPATSSISALNIDDSDGSPTTSHMDKWVVYKE
jgi:hypothetical protein